MTNGIDEFSQYKVPLPSQPGPTIMADTVGSVAPTRLDPFEKFKIKPPVSGIEEDPFEKFKIKPPVSGIEEDPFEKFKIKPPTEPLGDEDNLTKDHSLSPNEPWYSKAWHYNSKPIFDAHKLGGNAGWEQGIENVINMALTPATLEITGLIALALTGIGTAPAIAALGALGVDEAAAPIVISGIRFLVNAGFSLDMIGGLTTQVDEFLSALGKNDKDTAERIAVEASAQGLFTLVSGLAAAKDWGVIAEKKGWIKPSKELATARNLVTGVLQKGEEFAANEADKISAALHEIIKRPNESWFYRHLVGRSPEEMKMLRGIAKWIDTGGDKKTIWYQMKALVSGVKSNEVTRVGRILKDVYHSDNDKIQKTLELLNPEDLVALRRELEAPTSFMQAVMPALPDLPELKEIDFSGRSLANRAEKLGYSVHQITDKNPAHNRAWITPDGKYSIDVSETTHQAIAFNLLKDAGFRGTITEMNSLRYFLKRGAIRKNLVGNYLVDKLDDKTLNTLNKDFIASGGYGKQRLFIDYYSQHPYLSDRFFVSTIALEPYEYADVPLREAVNKQLRETSGDKYILRAERAQRQIPFDEVATQASQLHGLNGGSTFNIFNGNLDGQDAYLVSVHPEHNVVFDHPPTVEELYNYIQDPTRQALLNDPSKSLGTWKRDDTHHELDIVATPRSLVEALRLAREHKQDFIYDLRHRKTIPVTGQGATEALFSRQMPDFQALQTINRGPVVDFVNEGELINQEDYGERALEIYQKEVPEHIKLLATLFGNRIRLFASKKPSAISLTKGWMEEVGRIENITEPEELIDFLTRDVQPYIHSFPEWYKEQLRDVWNTGKPMTLVDPIQHKNVQEHYGLEQSLGEVIAHETGHIFNILTFPQQIFARLGGTLKEAGEHLEQMTGIRLGIEGRGVTAGEVFAETFAQMMKNPKERMPMPPELIETIRAFAEHSEQPVLQKLLTAESPEDVIKQLGPTNVAPDPHWGFLSKYLPDDLKQKVRKFLQKRVVQQFNKIGGVRLAKDIETIARAGQSQKGWYAETAQLLKSIFGQDSDLIADLVSAFSPQRDIEQNFEDAFNFYADWNDKGRPEDFEIISQMLRKSGFVPHDSWHNNIIRAIQRKPLSGTKVPEFAANLKGNLDRLAKDRHMAYGLGQTMKFWRNRTNKLAGEIAFRMAAKQMGWQVAEVQEAYWSIIRSLLKLIKKGVEPHEAGKIITDTDLQAGRLADLIATHEGVRASLDRIAQSTQDDRFRASNIQSSEGFGAARRISKAVTKPGEFEGLSRSVLAGTTERAFRASSVKEPPRRLRMRFRYTPQMAMAARFPPLEAGIEYQLKDRFGTTSDPRRAGFIFSDGSAVPQAGALEHNSMLEAAVNHARSFDPTIQGINREQYINQNKVIRSRTHLGTAGEEIVYSLPTSGVTPEQIAFIRRGAGAMSRIGRLVLEIADKHNGPSTTLDFPKISEIDSAINDLYKRYTPRFAQMAMPVSLEKPINLEPPDLSGFRDKYSTREKADTIAAYMHAYFDMQPMHIKLAEAVKEQFDKDWKWAEKHGMIRHAIENYITHTWQPGKAGKWWEPEKSTNEMMNRMLYQTHNGSFDTNIPFAKRRLFQSTFEGEIRGYKPRTEDPIALASFYHYRTGKSVAARNFISELMRKGTSAPDGSPLAAISGVAGLNEHLGDASKNPAVFIDNNRMRTHAIAQNVIDNFKETGQLKQLLDSGRLKQIGIKGEPDLAKLSATQKSELLRLEQALAKALDENNFDRAAQLGKERQKLLLKISRETPGIMQERPVYGWNVNDYQVIDHPAMRDWDYQTSAPDGTTIHNLGDIRVHPEAAEYIRRAIGAKRSAIRDWKLGSRKVEVGNLLLKASGGAKHLLLSLSPFHLVQEGLRAVMTGINPFGKLDYDLEADPVLARGVAAGLTLRSWRDLEEFTEGVGGHSAIIKKIPGIGRLQGELQDFLFNRYIPGLKARAYKALVERYRESGSANPFADAAAHTNEVFGGLNYRLLGRSTTTEDILRLGVLAPDWLESELRFMIRALGLRGKAGAKVAAVDMTKIGVMLFAATRVLNMISTGNLHLEAPFGVAAPQPDGTEKIYSLRTLPTDLLHAVSEPRNFLYGRLNPLTVRTGAEAITGKNQFGRRVTIPTEMTDLIKNVVPIPGQAKIMHLLNRGEDISNPDQVAKAFGITVYKYRTEAEKMVQEYASYYSMTGPVDSQQLALHTRNLRLEDMLRRGQITKRQVLGQLPRITANNIIENATLTPLRARFKRLPLKYQLQVWQVATAPEKDQLHSDLWRSRYQWLKTHNTLQKKQSDPLTYLLLKSVHPDLH